MPILNKKFYLRLLVLVVGFLFLFLGVVSAATPSPRPTQVKTKESSTVYFLSYKYGLKKPYVNAAAYLSYGNKWPQIKIISSSELATWSEAKLFRLATSSDIYYIQDQRKILVKSPTDLAKFNLAGAPVLEVGSVDLDQYQTASYAAIGWEQVSTSSLLVFNDQVAGVNDNTLVPNTDNNLLGVFRFQAPETPVTITSLTFYLLGIYNSSIISNVTVKDENNISYDANVNWRQNDHQIIINFRPALTLAANTEKIVKILTDLDSCSNCTNHALRLELVRSDINASLPAIADPNIWPLVGTQFKLVSNDNILGQVRIQAQSISDWLVGSGNRRIGKFTVYEDSGNEDALVKQLVFMNNGLANINDWEDFRLLKDGQIISRIGAVSNNNQIIFDINYLRIGKGSSAELTVEATIKSDYIATHTFNLQLLQATILGNTYNLTLNPEIHNISEPHPLN